VHGKFPGEVAVDGDSMIVNGDRIRVLAERGSVEAALGRARGRVRAGVHRVCSLPRPRLGAHLKGGAKKVMISAPGGDDVDATIVYGVNQQRVEEGPYGSFRMASCTTNLPCADRQGAARESLELPPAS